jgi:hypothetical protein
MTEIATTATMAPTETAPGGSDHQRFRPIEHQAKPLESSGFLPFRGPAKGRENLGRFAGHQGVALLNDALLRGSFPDLLPGA